MFACPFFIQLLNCHEAGWPENNIQMYCHCRCHVLSLRRIFEDISAEFEFVVCTELMLFREHLLLLQFYYVNNIPVTRYDDDQMRYIANIRKKYFCNTTYIWDTNVHYVYEPKFASTSHVS